MTIEVTDQNLKSLLAEGKPMVVDFWATWCGPCRMMSPVVDKMAEKFDGRVTVGKLNVDENPEACEEYGVMSIPTMLFFKNGELVDRHVGACPEAALEERINSLL